MAPRHRNKRLFFAGGAVAAIAGAAALVLTALNQNIAYFYTPSDLVGLPELPDGTIRLGGLVLEGSVQRITSLQTDFTVSDTVATYKVSYEGILPDLFREGQGVIAQGTITKAGEMKAATVLAKHDENYVPKELADALEEKGHIVKDQ